MRKNRMIDRVAARPDPAMWRSDELMTLKEAASLMWPDGFLTERQLRSAAKTGRLPISVVNGRYFVTREALALLSVCTPIAPDASKSEEPREAGMDKDLAIIRKLRSGR
jgi:hypothetical protein